MEKLQSFSAADLMRAMEVVNREQTYQDKIVAASSFMSDYSFREIVKRSLRYEGVILKVQGSGLDIDKPLEYDGEFWKLMDLVSIGLFDEEAVKDGIAKMSNYKAALFTLVTRGMPGAGLHNGAWIKVLNAWRKRQQNS